MLGLTGLICPLNHKLALDRKANFVLLHIIICGAQILVHQLIITIDDELEKEMSKYSEVDWAEVVKKAIREYLRRREIFEIYNAPIEKALSQKK